MTKADLVEIISAECGFSKNEAFELVEDVLELFKITLERGESLKISGFGNFNLLDKRQRTGRNPQTGARIPISAPDFARRTQVGVANV